MSLDVYLRMKVDTGSKEPHEVTLYDDSITHNLGKMAAEAGVYEALWRPEEIGITTAGELIQPLTKGLERLRSDPAHYQKFNPANGCSSYWYLVAFVFVTDYLAACKEHPKASVERT